MGDVVTGQRPGVDMTPNDTLPSRFWAKVNKDGPEIASGLGSCWLWMATLSGGPNGYGAIRVGGRMVKAHRLAYELIKGPTPEGFQLDHLCRVRRCVRPDHLEPVTAAVNAQRGDQSLRPEFCRHGHEFTPENTRWSPHDNGRGMRRNCRACGRERTRRYLQRRRGEEQ